MQVGIGNGKHGDDVIMASAGNAWLVGTILKQQRTPATRRFILEERMERGRSLGQAAPLPTDADKIVSSTVAGGAVGSIWSGVLYGSHRVIAGFMVFELLAGGVQMCATAANHVRQQIILSKMHPDQVHALPLVHLKQSLTSQWAGVKQRVGEHLAWLPVHRLSTAEHRELLQKRLDLVDGELEAVEQAMAAMHRPAHDEAANVH